MITTLAFFALPSMRPSVATSKRILLALGACVLGIALASYKVLGVAQYQAAYPRTVDPMPESLNLLQIAVLQLMPTFEYRLPAGLQPPPLWGIWEYSAFQLNLWVLLLLVLPYVIHRWRKRKTQTGLRPLTISIRFLFTFAAALFLTTLLFSLGSDSYFSLHYWLNVVLKGSVRVVGRYAVGLTLASLLLLVASLAIAPRLRRRYAVYAAVPALLLVNLNFLSFTTLRFEPFFGQASIAWIPLREMNLIAIVPARTLSRSYMYSAIRTGASAANCYNPIARGTAAIGEFSGHPEFSNGPRLRFAKLHPFVDEETGREQPECVAGSYFTQNALHIHESCKPGVCFNLNSVNPVDAIAPRLQLDKERRKLCMK
jgi:hypothetical protein